MASAVSNLSAANQTRFNAEAAAWDARPFVHTASRGACTAILSSLSSLGVSESQKKDLDVLEIGCGTGILTFLLAPHVAHITAVDAATGMIDVLRSKLQREGAPTNVTPLALLLEDPADPALPPSDETKPEGARRKYDLITSHLVLHHIPELAPVLATMRGCLQPGGMVMLTDFEDFGPGARSFHPAQKMDGVARHGIHAATMKKMMEDVGFREVDVRPQWTLTKRVERFDGEFGDAHGDRDEGRAVAPGQEEKGVDREFPFLVCFGRK